MPRRYQNKHDWAINPTPLIPMPGSKRRICSHGERVGALPTERAGVVEPHGEGEVTRGMRCDELAVKEDLCVVENSIEAEVELSSSCRDSGAELRRQREALSVPRHTPRQERVRAVLRRVKGLVDERVVWYRDSPPRFVVVARRSKAVIDSGRADLCPHICGCPIRLAARVR